MQFMAFCKVKDGILDTHPNPPQGRELDCYVLLCLLMYETLLQVRLSVMCFGGFAIRRKVI